MSENVILSKEALLKSGLPEEVVTVEGLGAVRIRSLSRAEFIQHRESDREGWEAGVVACGLVEPALTEDEVREWRKNVMPRVFDELAAEVLRISGLRAAFDEAVKETVKDAKQSFQGES